jgi:hypothetical protein
MDAITEAFALLKSIRKSAAHARCIYNPALDSRCELCRRIDKLLEKQEEA